MALNFPRFFPNFALSRLSRDHSNGWAALVDRISGLPHRSPERIAFTLTMRRLRHHTTGTSFHQHASDVCALCAMTILEAYKGAEKDLLAQYYANLEEVASTMKGMRYRTLKRHLHVA